MRNRIFGLVGVLWGGAVLVSPFVRGLPQGSAAYAKGQAAGFVFGAILAIVGAYYLFRGTKEKTPSVSVRNERRIGAPRRVATELARLLVAAIAGVVALLPAFWLSTLISGSNDIGIWVALPLSFIGVPALVLKLWPPAGAST